ncbi:MAG: hypothetical protein AB1324_06645 [Candidatus Micrarchaeota archaeon]
MASSKLAKLKEAVKKKRGGTEPSKAEPAPKAAEPPRAPPRAEPPPEPEKPDKEMTPEEFAMEPEPEKASPKPKKAAPADIEPEAPRPAPQKAKPAGPKPSPLTAPHAADVGSKIIRTVMDDTRLANFNQVSKVIMACMLRRGEVEGKIKSVKDIVDEEVKKALKEAA